MEKTVSPITILVVDNHEPMAAAFRDGLKQLFSCNVEAVTGSLDALRLLEQTPADLLIASHQLPHLDGLALAAQVRQLYPATAIMIVSSISSPKLQEQAIRLGIRHVLVKPVQLLGIREAVFDALRHLLDQAEVGGEGPISEALEHWIGQQAACFKPDLTTQEVMNLLDQWNRG